MTARRLLGLFVAAPFAVVVTYFGFCVLLLAAYNLVFPLTTAVQIQRRVEAISSESDYTKRYDPVPVEQINVRLQRAVVAAEDGRFYEHGGLDWEAIRKAIEDNRRRGRTWRGGSTITQQLVKNLFLTTHSSFVRKGFEVPLAYAAELLLSKDRILELYLNVIEWGPGVYGAEAAARFHYDTHAANLSRSQATRLAAVIPNPRSRTPQRMGGYAATIDRRMRQMGW